MKNNANTKIFYGEKSKPGQADSIWDTGTAYQKTRTALAKSGQLECLVL